MASADDQRVIIIGAGAAGLLIAQVLKKYEIPCVVFEQDASLEARPRDWNYGIYWAQSNLSECLPTELADQLLSVQVDSHVPSESDVLPILNGKTGESLVNVPAPYSLRLRRRRFLELISTGIDIRHGKRLAQVESDGNIVTVAFEDGTKEKGGVLVGTEGAHSVVRQYLLGEAGSLLPSEIVATATITKLPPDVAQTLRKVHSRYCITFHPDGYFTWYGIHNEEGPPQDWEFMISLSLASKEDLNLKGDAIVEDLHKRADTFAEPFRTILKSSPRGTRFWHSRLGYWPTQPWDNRKGTITLAGDAAHPMTFHRGQGLNNSILDAASLGEHIRQLETKDVASLKKAINAYDKELFPRGKEAVEGSNANSNQIHNWEQLKNSPLFTSGLKRH